MQNITITTDAVVARVVAVAVGVVVWSFADAVDIDCRVVGGGKVAG